MVHMYASDGTHTPTGTAIYTHALPDCQHAWRILGSNFQYALE